MERHLSTNLGITLREQNALRLRSHRNGGAWCPREMVSRDAKEYLEIRLEELHVITASKSQGRYGNGFGQEYAEEYMLEYWRPGMLKWVRWKNRLGKEIIVSSRNKSTMGISEALDLFSSSLPSIEKSPVEEIAKSSPKSGNRYRIPQKTNFIGYIPYAQMDTK
ncbi:hypothetical protein NQ317_007516 [Molorchus minor]|uniref:F5/8 type C domain-containing protein n=1 Tax=Molorchus minor TaxID=1323400 RepID=A0ABQ9JI23_9CUCU|nr:hypothetical protein NQ317_007516 [Molorchus minor]